ncbi:MAG: TonB-dependent receptor [Oligoflexia bacterium]|nr:TonB-dependent receptor [Oligoflexia bacterium]
MRAPNTKLFFYFLLLLLCFLNPALAQDVQKLEPTEVVATPLDAIGSRDTTRPVQIITESELKTEQRRYTDALNSLGGVQARLEGSPIISIRGSQSSARTLVMQDGIPLNFSDGVGFNPLFVATENLGSLALLRGPSSSLFGRDAMSGVLDFQSQQLERPKFYSGYGSFNTQQNFVGVPIKSENTSAQVTAYQTRTDGNFPYRVQRNSASGTRARNDSELLRSTLSAQGQADRVQWKTYHLIARQIGSTPQDINTPAAGTAFNNWGSLSAFSANVKIDETINLKSRTSFKYLDQRYNDQGTGRSQSLRQGLALSKKFEQVRFEIFDDYSTEFFRAGYLNSEGQSVNLNEVGASVQIPLGESVTLQSAVRVTNDTGTVLPSVGVTGVDENEWRYFANYAEGYRPADVTQKYGSFFGFLGNPSLRPERSREFDIGFEKNVTREVLIHFEAFSRDTFDLFDTRMIGENLTYQNVGRGRASGFEFRSEFHRSDLNGNINLAYLKNEQLDPVASLPLSPQVQASLFLEKTWSTWSIGAQETYWTSYYDRDSFNQLIDMGAWNTLDLFSRHRFTNNFNLRFSALNIFDHPRELRFGYPEPQRSFLIVGEATL